MKTPKWEKVEDGMYRTRTPSGWLVRESSEVAHIGNDKNEYITTGYDWRVSLTFVPDPDGLWLLEDEKS